MISNYIHLDYGLLLLVYKMSKIKKKTILHQLTSYYKNLNFKFKKVGLEWLI